MTKNEAIKRCDLLINGHSLPYSTHMAFTDKEKGYPTFEVMKMFAETCKYALEKQTPKKIISKYKSEYIKDIEYYGEDALFGYCPTCNGLQNNIWNVDNCGNCGQKLDWDL